MTFVPIHKASSSTGQSVPCLSTNRWSRGATRYNERNLVSGGHHAAAAPCPFRPTRSSHCSTASCLSSIGLGAVDVGSASTVQIFEPVVNLPALGSFLVIVIVFSALIFRVRAVDEAAERRKTALVHLRRVKSMELSSHDTDRPDTETVRRALKEYEEALMLEENLRTLVPGLVRVVAPSQPANEQDAAAAKQFLGLDLDESVLDSSPSLSKDTERERVGLSSGSVAVLVVVALSQLALLYMLSFDPMKM